MDSIDDNLGPDIDPKLATVLLNIWGKSKFSKQQKKEFKKIKVPGNAKFLTTPLLNPEIYNIQQFRLSCPFNTSDKAKKIDYLFSVERRKNVRIYLFYGKCAAYCFFI